jgi:outer membrane protein TolC
MRLKIFSILLIVTKILLGDNILSPIRQQDFKYSFQKLNKDTAKLKKDWINTINYTYSYSRDETNYNKTLKKSIINISQPIFKSGGIYNSIKYANSFKNSNSILLNINEKKLILQAYELLFNIYKTELLIKKQQLNIANAIINVKNKKESILNGVLDISFLNNAILTRNKQKENLAFLQFQKDDLINNFNNITNLNYKKCKLPNLKLLNKEQYIKQNLYIKHTQAQTKMKQDLKNITQSKYLPSININYSYIDNHTIDKQTKTYGFNVVIPFSFNTFDEIESKKIDYLKSKNQEQIVKRQEINFFKSQLSKINMIEKKISLTNENIKSYQSLLAQMNELAKAGIKTKDDVKILQNSKNAEALNIKILNIDKQIELLKIYGKIQNDFY